MWLTRKPCHNREIKIHVYANGKCEFLPRDQVSPLFFVYYILLLLHKNKLFYASFMQKNHSGQYLSAYFLFWEFLNLNWFIHVYFAVNVNLNLSNK